MAEAQQQDAGNDGAKATEGTKEFTPPASQEELDRIIGARIAREHAKFSDYDDLKAKAAKFDEAEDAAKNDTQKAIERAEKAEARANAAELASTRATVAAAKGVPVELLTGSTEEELTASAEALVKWRGEVDSKRYVSDADGKHPAPVPARSDDWLREEFKRK